MDPGETLTRWTVRVAVACYVAALALRGVAHRPAAARLAWTAGLVAFLLHVLCAFHFYHGWSHRAAYESTARQTAETVGLAWGGGLYVNYVFAVVWLADAGWWWVRPAAYQGRGRVIEGAVQGFLAFIAFNATVVFAAGPVRWFGVAACLGLVAVGGYRAAAGIMDRGRRT